MLKIGHVVTYHGKKPGDPAIAIEVPEELETTPGIPANQREVDWYSREYPLESMNILERSNRDWTDAIRDSHAETRQINREHGRLNGPLVKASRESADLEPTGKPTGQDVTDLIKNEARELGFSEVGIAAYDHRYTYQSSKDLVRFDHAICLAYEQEYGPSQTIPSIPAEVVHYNTYRTEQAAALELGNYIRSLGYRAQVHAATDNRLVMIPMFVNAGLGQLGACGYLLSPHNGNRQRMMIVTTDASVSYDQPVDLGMHAFCQLCQVCVNRCPGRALMRDKIWWRGVEKNKLYYKRCRPVMARYMGCGICMRVCPIQKYGMATVLAHYAETGQVLGKGTHDLEGYTLEGKGYFGPGEMPVFEPQFFDMPHGLLEDWALERLKQQYLASGNKITDEMIETFKQDLLNALGGEKNMATLQMQAADRDF